MATLRGTQKNDTLLGKAEDDQIFGLGGADRLYGGAGADDIRGGPGNDRLYGQAGADFLFGQTGADQLRGQAGADHLNGGPGADLLLGGAGIDVLTGGPGPDRFAFSSPAEGPDRITDFTPADRLQLTGALAHAAVRMVDDGTSTTVKVHTAAANAFTDLAVLEGHRAPIDVWYGDHQQFGDPGEAQRWVNVLGTVAPAGLQSLTYSLNGGAEHALAVGPNGTQPNFTRLVGPGDFNVELDYNQLNPSAANDTVHLRASYGNGELFTRDVTIDYEDGHAWPKNYSIDWSKVTDLQDVVQVVDGLWAFDANGVRPAVQGYDRVLAIGDSSWDSYRLNLSIEMHDLHTIDPRGRDGGGLLLGMEWNGHTNVPYGDVSPHLGWIPSGAFRLTGANAFLHPTEWFPQFNGNQNPIVAQPLQLQEGHTYNFLIENQRLAADTDPSDGIDRIYSLKVWEQGTPEPQNFLIQQIMVDQAPRGGIYLNAHYFDATFGDLTVKALPPSNEVLPAQNSLTALLGPESAPAPAAGPSAAPEAVAPGPSLTDLVASGDDAAPAV